MENQIDFDKNQPKNPYLLPITVFGSLVVVFLVAVIFYEQETSKSKADNGLDLSSNPQVVILNPNGGEQVEPGSNTEITWKLTGGVNAYVSNVAIYNGPELVSELLPPSSRWNSDTVHWSVPKNAITGHDFRVVVRVAQEGIAMVEDWSDGPFSIVPK